MALRSLSTAALRRELERREKGVARLARQRARLAAALAGLDDELASLGVAGTPARRGREPGRAKGPGRKPRARRARNELTLLEAIRKGVRVGATISPTEAAAVARRAGYRSSSPNLAMMCANALAKTREFRHTGRGAYLHVGTGGRVVKASKASGPARRGRRKGRKGRKARKAQRRVLQHKTSAAPAPRPATPVSRPVTPTALASASA
jgi:hypothetical protein